MLASVGRISELPEMNPRNQTKKNTRGMPTKRGNHKRGDEHSSNPRLRRINEPVTVNLIRN